MLDLYFPQDKIAYIPAMISLAIFVLAAIITMKLIMISSNREAKQAEELERKLVQDEKEGTSKSITKGNMEP